MDNFDIMANGTSMVEFGSLMDKLSASCKQIQPVPQAVLFFVIVKCHCQDVLLSLASIFVVDTQCMVATRMNSSSWLREGFALGFYEDRQRESS